MKGYTIGKRGLRAAEYTSDKIVFIRFLEESFMIFFKWYNFDSLYVQ